MNKIYDVNAVLINSVLPACSKEEVRYYLRGIHIEDEEGWRIYTATDGHVLFSVKEPICGEKLDESIDIYLKSALALERSVERVQMEVVNDDTVLFRGCKNKTIADIVDCNYPDWRRVVEFDADKKVVAHEYALFNPDYMKKAFKFSESVWKKKPFMVDSKSPAQWEENTGEYVKICVVMPMRCEE